MPEFRESYTLVSMDNITRLEIPDEEGHSYQLYRVGMLSTESEPAEAEGEDLNYNKHWWYITQENWQGGKEFIDHGYGERILPNGDRIWYKFDGQAGEEEITGGTGKFANIRGEGTYKGEMRNGIWRGWHHWEYELG